MAVLFASSAMAVVDPYEALAVTPAEGTVESLQHFTITFDGLPVVVNETAIPTLQKGGGATYEGSMRADETGTAVLVDFDVCCTVSGQYFLNLPEGSLTVNGQRLLPITLRFYIEGDMESFYNQITIDPAEGQVESLQYFSISLPEYVGEIEYGSMASLTNHTTGTTYRTDIYDVGFNVVVYFDTPFIEEGNYTLTIPAGAIVIYTLDEEVHELNFNYTIGGGAGFILGDVDDDGEVGIADVTALVDILLQGAEGPDAADVDQDGEVSIADVTALIDILLNSR